VEQQQYTNASQNNPKSHIADFLNNYAQNLQGPDHPTTLLDALGHLIPGYKEASKVVASAKKVAQLAKFGKNALADPKGAVKELLGHVAKQAGKVNPLLEPIVNSLPDRYTAYEQAQKEAEGRPSQPLKEKAKAAFLNLAAQHVPGADSDQGKAFLGKVLNDPANTPQHINDLLRANIPSDVTNAIDRHRNAIRNVRQGLYQNVIDPEQLQRAGLPLTDDDVKHLKFIKELHQATQDGTIGPHLRGYLQTKGLSEDQIQHYSDTKFADGNPIGAANEYLNKNVSDPFIRSVAQATLHSDPGDPLGAAARLEAKNQLVDKYFKGYPDVNPTVKNLVSKTVNGTLQTSDLYDAAQEHLPAKAKELINQVGDGSPEAIQALKYRAVASAKQAATDYAVKQVKGQVTKVAIQHFPGADTPAAQKFLGKVIDDPTNIKEHVKNLIQEQAGPIINDHLMKAQGIRNAGERVLTDPDVLKRFVPQATPAQLEYIKTLSDVHKAATTGTITNRLGQRLQDSGLEPDQVQALASKPLKQWTPDDLARLSPQAVEQHPLFKSIAYYAQHAEDSDTQKAAALESVKQHLVGTYLDQHAPDLPPAVKRLAQLGINDNKSPEALLAAAKEAVPDKLKPVLDAVGKGHTLDLQHIQRDVVQKGIDAAPLEDNAKTQLKLAYNATVKPDANDKYASVRHIVKAGVAQALPGVKDDLTRTLLTHAPDAIDFLPGGKNELTRENIKKRAGQIYDHVAGEAKAQINAELGGINQLAGDVVGKAKDYVNSTKEGFNTVRDQVKAAFNKTSISQATPSTPAESAARSSAPDKAPIDRLNVAAGIVPPEEEQDAHGGDFEQGDYLKPGEEIPPELQAPKPTSTALPRTTFQELLNGKNRPPPVNRPAREAVPEEDDDSFIRAVHQRILDSQQAEKPVPTDVRAGTAPQTGPTIPIPADAKRTAEAEIPTHAFPAEGIHEQIAPSQPAPVTSASKRLKYSEMPARPIPKLVPGSQIAAPRGLGNDEFGDYLGRDDEFGDGDTAPSFLGGKFETSLSDTLKYHANVATTKIANAGRSVYNGMMDKIDSLRPNARPPASVESADLKSRTFEQAAQADPHQMPVKRPRTNEPPTTSSPAASEFGPSTPAAQAVYQDAGQEAGEGDTGYQGLTGTEGAFNGNQVAENDLNAEAANQGGQVANNVDENAAYQETAGNKFTEQANTSAYQNQQERDGAIGGFGVGVQAVSDPLGEGIAKVSKAAPSTTNTTNKPANEAENSAAPGDASEPPPKVGGATEPEGGQVPGSAVKAVDEGEAAVKAADEAAVSADLVNTGEQAGISIGEAAGDAIPGVGAVVAAAAAGYSLYQALTTSAPSPPPPQIVSGSEATVLPTYQATSNASTGAVQGTDTTSVLTNAGTAADTLSDQLNEFTS
jgi:hypothetical protein